MSEPRAFEGRGAWRRWLEKHHDSDEELWIVFYKKDDHRPSSTVGGARKQTFTYEDAVEEALCFGWVDGIVKRRDEETFMQRFSPRGRRSTWSESNLKRVRRLIDAGLMTDAGLAKLGGALEAYEERGECHRPPRTDAAPEPLMALLRADAKAWAAFERLAPSHRREYLGWVTQAKKPETQLRRMNEVIRVLARGEKLGMK